MHTPGVLGDIAADSAGDLAGRVRCVVEAIRRSGFGNRKVATPGSTAAVRAFASTRMMRLNFARESRTPDGWGSALPASPVPAPRARSGLHASAKPKHASQLQRGFPAVPRPRYLPDERQPIALVRARVLLVDEDAMRRQNISQSFQQRPFALRVRRAIALRSCVQRASSGVVGFRQLAQEDTCLGASPGSVHIIGANGTGATGRAPMDACAHHDPLPGVRCPHEVRAKNWRFRQDAGIARVDHCFPGDPSLTWRS